MFGFGKKSKVFCFHISNFDEIFEKDIDAPEKLENGSLEHYCFPARMDSNEGVYCVYVDYKEDPLLENPNFSVEDMRQFIESIGFSVISVTEKE